MGLPSEESPACSWPFWISSNAASKKEPGLAEGQVADAVSPSPVTALQSYSGLSLQSSGTQRRQ